MDETNTKLLKRGWTTGACATAATKAALTALLGGGFPDPVEIVLPKGQTPAFALALEGLDDNEARAGIIKDAGDDPDVTHGCLVISTVRLVDEPGVVFKAGEGVGTVTKAGLPIDVGEPAINPVPRQMMVQVVEELIQQCGPSIGVEVEISIQDGARLAEKTWNPRLGIVGGLSVLGTTGIVNPFSCSAWIASIHRGIDVARAEGLQHLAGATGSTSEKAVQDLYGLPDQAMIDMGDFVGGLLKYLRQNPVERVTIGGGLAKLTKLAQGALDLHSGRSQVDFDWLASEIAGLGGPDELCKKVAGANTVLEVASLTAKENLDIGPLIADKARITAQEILRGAPVRVDIIAVDRKGKVVGRSG
ncbi:MAG TPA: cobalt-precorrin-5B (C(1))-methyltransferase [Rhizobiales bacterium]|nr:cobalt-precorrin-5B (C(1))-methyltransferase [Hyphomicrobiales bacterium]